MFESAVTRSNYSNCDVYLDIIAISVVTFRVLSRLTAPPAFSQAPKSISHVNPLESHSCTLCTHKPFRITFLQKTPGGWVSLPLSPSLPETGRTDRMGAESKGPLWD